jgi:glycosyltransferase involved in cell wall biosynthesis
MGEDKRMEGGKRLSDQQQAWQESLPVISFIVAIYNSAETLETTLLSILGQTYPNKELLIIDGGSTDGSLDIIRRFDNRIDYWISEPDNGIGDAFNKGVKLAEGIYLNFQGAGDVLESDGVISEMVTKLGSAEPQFISGKIRRVDEKDINKTLWISPQPRSEKFDPGSLLWKMSLYHQGLFTHRSFFEKYGYFDESLRFSMDYEHLLRAYKHFPDVLLVNMIISRWRADGVGQNRDLEIFREYNLIKRKNRIAPGIVLTLVNYWIITKFRIKQIIA